MTLQPSDDCYNTHAIEEIKRMKHQATGYTKGYIVNYQTMETCEYNPETNPPFYSIKFPKEIFIDPLKHLNYTGPYHSHEYVPQFLKYDTMDHRGFLVGTHGENISTHFNHPYKGQTVTGILEHFGLTHDPLKIKYSIRKQIMRKLPHGWQRKLRYIFGEKLFNRFYNFIRS